MTLEQNDLLAGNFDLPINPFDYSQFLFLVSKFQNAQLPRKVEQASNGVQPSPQRQGDTRPVMRDPLLKFNNKTRADRAERARTRGLEKRD